MKKNYYRHRKGYKTGSSTIYVQIYHSFNVIKPGNLTKQCQWQGFIGTKECTIRVTHILSLQKWSKGKGRGERKRTRMRSSLKVYFRRRENKFDLGIHFNLLY